MAVKALQATKASMLANRFEHHLPAPIAGSPTGRR
jgi:hypothetical protein